MNDDDVDVDDTGVESAKHTLLPSTDDVDIDVSLYSLVQSYRPSLHECVIFFALASLSAIAFCVTWLTLFYSAAAGTVYVGAKFLAANVRIENGAYGAGGRQQQRMAYGGRGMRR